MRISLLVLRTACFCLGLAGAIAQAQTLRVATLEWAPYVGSDLPGNGLASRILNEALALNGDKAELVFLPWQRALNETREGRFDALMPAYLSPDRRQDFYTSMPLWTPSSASSAVATAPCRSTPATSIPCAPTASA